MPDDRLYRNAIALIRKNIETGQSFDLACEALSIEDEDLKKTIIEDALKIEIAELHYGKNIPLLEVSKRLQVSIERLMKANDEMLEDVMYNMHHIFKNFLIESGSTNH